MMATGRYISAVQQNVHCQSCPSKRSTWKGQAPPPKNVDAILRITRADRRSADYPTAKSTPGGKRGRALSASSRDEPRFDFEAAADALDASSYSTGAIASAVIAVALVAAPSAQAIAAVSPAVSTASHHVPLGLRILHHTVSGLFLNAAPHFLPFQAHQGAPSGIRVAHLQSEKLPS